MEKGINPITDLNRAVTRLPPVLLPGRYRDFHSVNHHKSLLCRMATEHQARAHAEATNRPVARHIGLWRFDAVFLQASLERRQIEATVLGAESIL